MRQFLRIQGEIWYHADMKKLSFEKTCRFYGLLMGSLFLLAVSPLGYRNIVETKAAVFYVLTVLFLLLSVICLRKEGRSLHPFTILDGLILAYWGWSLLSAFCSPWRDTAFLGANRCDGMLTITLYCAVFFLLRRRGEADLRLIWVPATALCLFCLVAALQFFDLNPLMLYPGDLRWSGREREYNGAFLSLTGNADLTASVLCTGFGILWSCALERKKPWLLLPAAACLGVLLASGIRGGILGAMGGLVLCLPAALPIRRKAKLWTYAGLAVLALGFLMLVRSLPMQGTLGELHALLNGQADASFGTGRIYIWRQALDLIRERPLLGGGADTMGLRGLYFERMQDNGLLLRRTIDCAHNEYLNITVNQGIPALLCFLAALGIGLVRAFSSSSACARVFRAGLVSYMIDAFFGIATPANAAFFWLLFGLLSAAAGHVDKESAEIDKVMHLGYNE